MNVQKAWNMGYTGKGVAVTILDDGIETEHPDLKNNYVSVVLMVLTEKYLSQYWERNGWMFMDFTVPSTVFYFCLVRLMLGGGERLTLKAPITTAADDIHKYYFIVFQRK